MARDSGALTCAEVTERIYPLLLRTISDGERAVLLDHLATCDACRLALDAGRGRLRKIVDPGMTELIDIGQPRRSRRRRLWRVLLPVVPAAVAFSLLFQQGVRLARYRYEQRFVARLEKALILYRADFGEFPPANGTPLSLFLGTRERNGPYLELAKERRDGVGHFIDHWGNRYLYRCPGEHNPRLFDLHSFGQNGRDDGGKGDDVTNWEQSWERIEPSR